VRKFFLHILFLLGGLAPLLCMGQTGNFWAFQKNKGLDFNTVPPSIIYPTFENQQSSSSNSSSAISDCDGNVLFYASADIVYNALGDTMENGLLKINYNEGGSQGIGKSAMTLVPKPGQPFRYLLFYMNVYDQRNSSGLNSFLHAEIDILANSGLGTVVFKDSLVGNMNLVTCNLDVVKHANDTDFWLITTPNESTYHCYKIDSNGLNQTPVVSSGLSQIHNNSIGVPLVERNHYGFTRFTRDGKYLIATGLLPSQSTASVLRYDFNPGTGQLSNPFTLISHTQLPTNHTTSALEISPNNEIAYFTSQNNLVTRVVTEQYLWQVNIRNLSNFKTLINSRGFTLSLTLGPDNKIYFLTDLLNPPSLKIYPGLHYIPRPNEWGNKMGMRYLDTIVFWELFSLPRAYVPVYDYNFTSTLNGDCVDTVAIHYKGDTTFKQITLYYGDGDSTVVLHADIEERMTFKHRYTSDGTKNITMKLETFFCSSVKYLYDNVYIRLKPDIDSLSIASIAPSCSSDTAELSLYLRSTDSLSIRWSNDHLEDYLITKNDLAARYRYQSDFDEDTSRQIYLTAKSTNGCVSYDTVDYTPARLRTDSVRYAISGYRDLQSTLGTPHYFSCVEDEVLYSDSTTALSSGGISSGLWSIHYANSNQVGLEYSSNASRTFIISDTNTLGCIAKDTFLLTIYASPASDFTFADDSICASEQIVTATNQTTYTDLSTITTEWFLDNAAVRMASGRVDYTANLNTVGSYKISLVSTSDVGCADTLNKDFVVLANPVASYTWEGAVFCSEGGLISLVSDSISGFVNSWSLNSSAAVTGNSYIKSSFPLGANTVSYISKNGYGCSDTIAISFTINQSVKTSLSAEDDSLCAGQEPIRIGLTANAADFSNGLTSDVYRDNLFVESKSALFVQDLSYASDSVGTFIYEVITHADTRLCADTQQIAITVLESPKNEKLTLDGGTCLGTSFEVYYGLDNEDKLAGSLWQFGDGRTEEDQNNLSHTYTTVGTYDLIIKLTLTNGCEREIVQSVTVIPPPEVDFKYSLESISADEVLLTLLGTSSNSISEWKWSSLIFGELTGNPIVRNTRDTGFKEITLAIKDIYGCENSTTQVIPVYPEAKFYIPNAFTPNGDGLNDRLAIVPAYFIKKYSIQVYNRWGEKVYDGSDLKNWVPTLTGVFIYQLTITDIFEKQKFMNGTVTVLE
jgi:gliding motility-associated-like protein